MTITGIQKVTLSVEVRSGYSYVDPESLEWDSQSGQWRYDTVYVPWAVVYGWPVYTCPEGKRILAADDLEFVTPNCKQYGDGWLEPLIQVAPTPPPLVQPPRPPGNPPFPRPSTEPDIAPVVPPTQTLKAHLIIGDAA